jgi:hypothetical protein
VFESNLNRELADKGLARRQEAVDGCEQTEWKIEQQVGGTNEIDIEGETLIKLTVLLNFEIIFYRN